MTEVKVEEKVDVKDTVAIEVKERVEKDPVKVDDVTSEDSDDGLEEVIEGVAEKVLEALQGDSAHQEFVSALEARYIKVLDICGESMVKSSSNAKMYMEVLSRIESTLKVAYAYADSDKEFRVMVGVPKK